MKENVSSENIQKLIDLWKLFLVENQKIKSSNKIKNEFAKGMLEGSIIVYSHSIEALENLIK